MHDVVILIIRAKVVMCKVQGGVLNLIENWVRGGEDVRENVAVTCMEMSAW